MYNPRLSKSLDTPVKYLSRGWLEIYVKFYWIKPSLHNTIDSCILQLVTRPLKHHKAVLFSTQTQGATTAARRLAESQKQLEHIFHQLAAPQILLQR